MEQQPTRVRTTLAVSVLALTQIAPWVLGQVPDAITEIRRRAEQGHAEAQFIFGTMYANAEGVPKNDAEAVKWYRLAVDRRVRVTAALPTSSLGGPVAGRFLFLFP